MFSKPIIHDKSEQHPEFKKYLYRYKLNNMLDEKKSSFDEFMKLSIKDDLTEAEAKRFIGYLTAKKKSVEAEAKVYLNVS